MSTEIESLQREVQPVLTRASQIAIRTVNDRTDANGFLVAIKTAQKQVHETFDESVEAAHQAHKKALALRASFLGPLEKAEKQVKTLCRQWDDEQERHRAEEQRRLQAIERERAEKERLKAEQGAAKQRAIQEQKEREAAEARRKAEEADAVERKRLLAQAEAAERKAAEAAVKVEEKQEQAASVVEHVVTVSGPEKQKGEATKTKWKARLTNKHALIVAAATDQVAATFLNFDQSVADKQADTWKGTVDIPGVEWYQEKHLAIRTGGR